MSQDLVRLIDGICRDKNIDRDSFIEDLTNSLITALKKAHDDTEDVQVDFDRINGRISAVVNGAPVEMGVLGRIAAQVAKQGIIQKTRERERTSIFEEFSERQGTVVTGNVSRIEGPALIVNIGRAEGFLPRSEQIPGEAHQTGDRIRCLILEVREMPHQIRIVLSRSHPDFIARLFELEVPEVAEHIIEIKALAREAGYRTKVAVSSIDSKVDAVGACVGVRGSRIKNIVEELGGEKIDIVRWNESSQILIGNALKPAEVQEIALCFELGKASVVVAEDQLSLAIGKRGQNVRLAARLTQWDIDIMPPTDYNRNLEVMEQAIKRVEGVDDLLVDKFIAMGCTSVEDIEAMDVDPLINEMGLEPELAEKVVYEAAEEAIRLQEQKEAAQKLRAERIAAGLPPEPVVEAPAEDGEQTDADADAETAALTDVAAEETTGDDPAGPGPSGFTEELDVVSDGNGAEPALTATADATLDEATASDDDEPDVVATDPDTADAEAANRANP
jgi:N utilization substance protein A